MADIPVVDGTPIAASDARRAQAWTSNPVGQGQTAAFTTDWHKFTFCDIAAAISGTATSITAVVERSTVDPNFLINNQPQGAIISPADPTGFSGNLSLGISPKIYTEPGVGWWRINVTAISGGNCTAGLTSSLGGPLWPT